jgi:PAS domain-containing protein
MRASSQYQTLPVPSSDDALPPGLAAVPEVRSLLEAVDLPIGRWDAEGRLTFFNPPYVSWARRTPQALHGKSLKELYGEDAWTAARPAFERRFQGQQADYLRLLRHLDPPPLGAYSGVSRARTERANRGDLHHRPRCA